MNQPMTPPHPFDLATALRHGATCSTAQASPAYYNMVGPFGGVTAATLLNAVLQHPDRLGTPVSLTVNFLGPLNGEPIELYPTLVRANRSNQHWTVELKQGDSLQCNATVVLASRLDTWECDEAEAPNAPDFESLAPLPALPLPPWVNQYDIRFVSGSPFTKDAGPTPQRASESVVWMQDQPPRKLDFLSLAALCDAFFPRLFVRTKRISPIGTVSLTIYFHVREAELSALNAPQVLGHARANRFFGSYFDQTAELYDANRRLLATTTQLVYYKA